MNPSSDRENLQDLLEAGRQFASRETSNHLRGSGTSAEACVDLVASLNRQMEATIAHATGREGVPAIACRAGCSFCCHIPVEIAPHEAVALYDHLQTKLQPDVKAAVTERLLANRDRISTMTKAEHAATNVQCAFLVDHKCSAYGSRPLACASHHSFDVSPCEESYKHPEIPESEAAPIPKSYMLVCIDSGMKSGVLQALDAAKLNNETFELNTAVAALVKDPSSIRRWRSGYWRRLVKISD